MTINRRNFLKGLGLATGIGTSLLGSTVALGATDEAPMRILLVALTHGWGQDPNFNSVFTGSEFDFQLPSHLAGFESIKDECVFIDGVRGTLWGNAHDVSYSDIFTAAVPWDETGSMQLGQHFPEPMGPSLDWMLGQHTNKQVLRVSAGYRSWGRRSNPLCFDDQARVLDSYFNPRDAYDAIIDPIRGSTQPPALGRQAVRQNLFDYLGRDTDRLLQKVSGTERTKVEGYLQAINDLGNRIMMRPDVVLTEDDLPDRPTQSPAFEAMVDNYFDMIRVSFQADTHRAAVLGFGQGIEGWTWRDKDGMVRTDNPWVSDFHHNIAHHSIDNDPDLNPRLAFEGWVSWYVDKIVEFAQTLKNTPDVDGKSLLDNTIIMLTGEVGTGTHDRRSKLHTLIGGGDRLRRGRWMDIPGINPRSRDGVFIGGQERNGNEVTSGLNYGRDLSVMHTADVLKAIGNLAGMNITQMGLETNNRSPMELDLT